MNHIKKGLLVMSVGLLFGLSFFPQSASAENWWTRQIAFGVNDVVGPIASSADGMKIVTSANGNIRTSTDGGVTWVTRTGAGNHQWGSIASSGDGMKLVATINGSYDYIRTSTDGGVTWVTRTGSGSRLWLNVASSSDGMKLFATNNIDHNLYVSVDGGATWIARNVPATGLRDVAVSADGTKVLVSGDPGNLYTSTDGGMTWTTRAADRGTLQWIAVASSSDGMKLVAASNAEPYGSSSNGYVYTSTNGGVTWTQISSASAANWRDIASSADGTKLIAASYSGTGHIYTSEDGGSNWITEPALAAGPWFSVASSSDGMKLIVGRNNNSSSDSDTNIFTAPTTTTSLASVTTLPATSIGQTTATLNYTLNSTGVPSGINGLIIAGVEYQADGSPSPYSFLPGYGIVEGSYSLNLAFSCGTLYYYRAVANNYLGSSYGNYLTFTTLPCATPPPAVIVPTVVTVGSTSVTQTNAILQGNLTSLGGAVTASSVGFEYGTTTAYGFTTGTTSVLATGPFVSSTITTGLSGVVCGTLYHYRAFAQNSAGTGYGIDRTFTTLPCATPPPTTGGPTVITTGASSIVPTSAIISGKLLTLGAYPVKTRGFEYGTTTSYGNVKTFTLRNSMYNANTAFTGGISGLTCGTVYHYRAYATNVRGVTSYGNDMTFTSGPCPQVPTLTTQSATIITTKTAIINGTLVSLSGAGVKTRGFEYGTTTSYGNVKTFTLRNTVYNANTTFNAGIAGLSCGTLYHYRPYAVNSAGTGYGPDATFTTSPCPVGSVAPAVTTLTPGSIGATAATLNGRLTSLGDATSVIVGFNYGTSLGYGSTVRLSANLRSPSNFSFRVTGLACGREYHVRSYAQSISTTSNGADMVFTTAACPSLLGANVIGSIETDTVVDNQESVEKLASSPLTRSLYMGQEGEDVTAVQDYLFEKGYLKAPARGYYGILTATAVKEFQRANGLDAIGSIGPKTRNVINNLWSENR